MNTSIKITHGLAALALCVVISNAFIPGKVFAGQRVPAAVEAERAAIAAMDAKAAAREARWPRIPYAKNASPITRDLVASAAIVLKNEHLKVTGDEYAVDVSFELVHCGRGNAVAVGKEFRKLLTWLLPAMMQKSPHTYVFNVEGGCDVVDPYGKSSFDENVIKAQFNGDELAKVNFSGIDPDSLFEFVSSSHWENPELRDARGASR